jgi:hypothetical protein
MGPAVKTRTLVTRGHYAAIQVLGCLTDPPGKECQDRVSKLQPLSADYSLKSKFRGFWLSTQGRSVPMTSHVARDLGCPLGSSRICARMKKFASARLEEGPRPISRKPGEIRRV